jgi:hypothetical protein
MAVLAKDTTDSPKVKSDNNKLMVLIGGIVLSGGVPICGATSRKQKRKKHTN